MLFPQRLPVSGVESQSFGNKFRRRRKYSWSHDSDSGLSSNEGSIPGSMCSSINGSMSGSLIGSMSSSMTSSMSDSQYSSNSVKQNRSLHNSLFNGSANGNSTECINQASPKLNRKIYDESSTHSKLTGSFESTKSLRSGQLKNDSTYRKLSTPSLPPFNNPSPSFTSPSSPNHNSCHTKHPIMDTSPHPPSRTAWSTSKLGDQACNGPSCYSGGCGSIHDPVLKPSLGDPLLDLTHASNIKELSSLTRKGETASNITW